MSSLLKAFDVLDCFQDDKQELGISDIAVLVGMPVSSVHRLIQSLEYEGMLIQNRENKKYSLGSKLMAMSVKCRTSRSFGRIASKYVDQLGQLTGETVNLSTCSGDRIINVYHAESHFVLRPNFPLYTSYPAYKTSVGRVFLSWMGDPALKWIYENNKDDISMTQEEFLAMLHQARRDGYALDDQVFSAGLRCVAAPVFLTGSKPMFAIVHPRRCRGWTMRSMPVPASWLLTLPRGFRTIFRPLRRGPDTHHIHRRRTGDPVRRFCLYGHLRCRRRQSQPIQAPIPAGTTIPQQKTGCGRTRPHPACVILFSRSCRSSRTGRASCPTGSRSARHTASGKPHRSGSG